MEENVIDKVIKIVLVVLTIALLIMGVKVLKGVVQSNDEPYKGKTVLLLTLETRDGRKSTPDYIFEGIGDTYKGAEIYKEKVKGEIGEVASLVDKYEPTIVIGVDQGSRGIKVYSGGYTIKGKTDFNTNEEMIKYNLELNKFKNVEVEDLKFGNYFNTFMMDIRTGISLRGRKIVYGGISVPLIKEQVKGQNKMVYGSEDVVDAMKIMIESVLIEHKLEGR